MINWNNIAELLTRILMSNGGLPVSTGYKDRNFTKVVFTNGKFFYQEDVGSTPLKARIAHALDGKALAKEDIIELIWDELNAEERIQLAAEVLGRNDGLE